VQHLVRYARSADQRDYRLFQNAIAIPLGDHRARLELERRPDFDEAAARQGFLDGANDPDDIGSMIFLFRRFRSLWVLDRAIEFWAEADVHIERLVLLAEDLHREIEAGTLGPDRQRELL